MTLTKLQTLYRAAVAAEPSVAVPELEITDWGEWINTKYNEAITEGAAASFISRGLGVCEKSVFKALERIARKEASK
jgi:hypothetical protein